MSERRPLDDLETVHLLEETIGPRSLRDLRSAFPDEAERRLLETLARNAADDRHELDDVIHVWKRMAAPPAAQARKVVEQPDVGEIVDSLVELKESEAEVLRRAANHAPNERLRERLLALAARSEAMGEKLKSLA